MRKGRLIAMGLMVTMALTSLTACDIKSDSPIVGKLVGLKSDEIFKVGELICTTPEYMLVLMNTQNQYKNDLGQTVDWNIKVQENTTLKDFLMKKVKDEISLKYTLAEMAKTNNVSLTEEEIAEIAKASNEYFSAMSSEEKDYTGAEAEDVQNLYSNYYLAEKVYSKLTENVAEKISDEEARVIKIQYIRMNTSKNKADEIKSTLKSVVDLVNGGYQQFSGQAKQYSEDSSIEKVLKKNEISDKKYEIEAFKLNDKEISNIIQEGNDYYLVYCAEGYLKKETESNKQKIISQAKKEYFDKKYSTFLESVETDFNNRAWKKLDLSNDNNVKSINLITTYETIKK